MIDEFEKVNSTHAPVKECLWAFLTKEICQTLESDIREEELDDPDITEEEREEIRQTLKDKIAAFEDMISTVRKQVFRWEHWQKLDKT